MKFLKLHWAGVSINSGEGASYEAYSPFLFNLPLTLLVSWAVSGFSYYVDLELLSLSTVSNVHCQDISVYR